MVLRALINVDCPNYLYVKISATEIYLKKYVNKIIALHFFSNEFMKAQGDHQKSSNFPQEVPHCLLNIGLLYFCSLGAIIKILKFLTKFN
jgi:hypothetical protein